MEYTVTDVIRDRIRAGAALLDQHYPGWQEEICIPDFDICHAERCILGQLYGDYADGAFELGINIDPVYADSEKDEGILFGFDHELEMIDNQHPADILPEEWKGYLQGDWQ